MLLADVNAMWLMAINAFVSDVVDTCFVDNESTLRYYLQQMEGHIIIVVDVITTVADGITTIG